MILVDTGPLVALHNPKDPASRRCAESLDCIGGTLLTTVAVLTEAFHILPGSQAESLMDFIDRGGVEVRELNDSLLSRSFRLMVKYADRPMDFADATLVATAEHANVRTVFTLDRDDFSTYRIKRGHRNVGFRIIP